MKDNKHTETHSDITPYYRRRNYLTPPDMFKGFFKDEFFRPFFSEDYMKNAGSITIDIRDEAERYVVEAEVPGYKKDEIELDIHEGVLTIKAHRESEESIEKENYVYRERSRGSVCRSFTLDNIKEDEISAEHKDGLLTISLPKAETHKDTDRKIDIH